MTKATETQLDGLHGLLAEHLANEIRNAASRPACDECGCRPGIPPALLAQAIKFLKDNGIDTPARAGNRVDRLKGLIPDMDELEKGNNIVPIRK